MKAAFCYLGGWCTDHTRMTQRPGNEKGSRSGSPLLVLHAARGGYAVTASAAASTWGAGYTLIFRRVLLLCSNFTKPSINA
jgi:hypothetical protein